MIVPSQKKNFLSLRGVEVTLSPSSLSYSSQATSNTINNSLATDLESNIPLPIVSEDNVANIFISVNITLIIALFGSIIAIVNFFNEDGRIGAWLVNTFKAVLELVMPVFWVMRSTEISDYALRKIGQWKSSFYS